MADRVQRQEATEIRNRLARLALRTRLHLRTRATTTMGGEARRAMINTTSNRKRRDMEAKDNREGMEDRSHRRLSSKAMAKPLPHEAVQRHMAG